jgi:hypothetical protein
MASTWFGEAVAADGGLWLPGRPPRTAELHVGADGATLRAGPASARFRWDGHRSHERSAADGWAVTWATSTRAGSPIGIAIEVALADLARAKPVVAATATVRNRLGRAFRTTPLVPLRSHWRISRAVDAERDTLAALCASLAERPALRAALRGPERVDRLIEAMAAHPLRALPERTGTRRASMEVLATMHRLGYRHRIGGRPLPGDDLPPEGRVVDHVMTITARNPWARDVALDHAHVVALVRRTYSQVTPWPFAALLTD